MKEPKSCPFCGKTESVDIETAEEIEGIPHEDAALEFAVVCNFQKGGCSASSGYSLTKEGAVERWNRRAATENHIADADKMVPSSNKAPTCNGCAYKIDFPASIHCFGCARMYSDHYARCPEDAK